MKLVHSFFLLAVLFISQVICSAEAPALNTAVSERGIQIDAGSMGKFFFPVPALRRHEKDYSGEKPAAVEVQGNTFVASYASGANVRGELFPAEQKVVFSFDGVPTGAWGFVALMTFPMSFNQGGRFSFDQAALTPLPESKEKAIIQGTHASRFNIVDPLNHGLSIILPHDYHQLGDNRFFNWPVFAGVFNFTFVTHPGQKSFEVKFAPFVPGAEGEPSAASQPKAERKILLTRFGQSARKDFPEKVKDVSELVADIPKQKALLGKFDAYPQDDFRGLAGSGAQYHLKKTGFFHVEDLGHRKVMVTPEGNVFFHLATCAVNADDATIVAGRENAFEWLPPKEKFGPAWRSGSTVSFFIANWIQKYNKPFSLEEYSAQSIERLRAWGFNSTGAFTPPTEAMKTARIPYVLSLPLNRWNNLPMLPEKIGAAECIDPFAPNIGAAMEKVFESKVYPKADDPLLIGYFLGNEQHFELVPKRVPTFKASQSPSKRKLVELLENKYGEIANFNAAWNPVKPFASFDEAREQPLIVRTEAAADDMRSFFRLFLETYFETVDRVFHKYDQNHLLIGCRWTPSTANNADVVTIAGKHLDVVSVNYYTYPMEMDFLKKIYERSGQRPIILSEWYYSAADQGLGTLIQVNNQQERGLAYRHYVEQAASTPYVVGSEWFSFLDQPLTGRSFEGLNGEGNNIGFVNVADRPYEELVKAALQTHKRIYDVMLGKVPPFSFDDPRFASNAKGSALRTVAIPRALASMKFDGSTTNWPGRPATPIESSRLVFGNSNQDMRGDFRVCWDDKALYFLIQVKDHTPMLNGNPGPSLWKGDGIELFIGAKNISEGGTMVFSDRQIILGASPEPKIFIADHPEESAQCQSLVIKDVSGDGYVLEASIPWSVLGVKAEPGLEMLFDVAIDNSDNGATRAQQLMWNGTAKNSGDRGGWGRAHLVEN